MNLYNSLQHVWSCFLHCQGFKQRFTSLKKATDLFRFAKMFDLSSKRLRHLTPGGSCPLEVVCGVKDYGRFRKGRPNN